MKQLLKNTLLPALAALAVGQAQAGYIGTTVTATLSSSRATTTFPVAFTPTAVVGAGIEFQGSVRALSSTRTIDLDISDDQFTVHLSGGGGSLVYAVAGDPLFFITLDGLPDSTLLSLTSYVCSGSDFSCNYKTPQSNVVTSASGTRFTIGFNAMRDDETYTFGTVPEPGSVALVGLALAGLVAQTRRKG